MVSEGSIIELSFTGKTIEGQVFETTSEEKAKEAKFETDGQIFGPKTFILGEGELLVGIENALKEMNEKESKTIKLSPEIAFGSRQQELIAVLPLKEFTKRKIMPFPGLILDLDGKQARVQSVSGGRVRVDFNHPLAGKEVEFELKLEKVLTESKEQMAALIRKFFAFIPEKEISFEINGENCEIKTNTKYEKILKQLDGLVSKIFTKYVKGLKTISYKFEGKTESENPEQKKEATAETESKQME